MNISWKAIIYFLLIIIVLSFPLSALAETVNIQETDLVNDDVPVTSIAASIHIDEYQNVYVVDENYQLWKVNPTSGDYLQVFPLGGGFLADIAIASADSVWWSDFETNFGKLNLNTGQVQEWSIDITNYSNQPLNIGPIAVLGEDLWIASWAVATYGLFKFDGSNICLYQFPVGLFASDLIVNSDMLWALDWSANQLVSMNPVNGQFIKYSYGGDIGEAANLQAEGDFLWWAEDIVNGRLIRFDTVSQTFTAYTLPLNNHARNLFIQNGKIWYSDKSGSFGRLDPEQINGDDVTSQIINSGTITPTCLSITSIDYLTSVYSGSFEWDNLESTIISPQSGLDVYSLSEGSEPYGIGAAGGYVWVSDRGRQKFIRLQLEVEHKVFLPLLTK